MTNFEEDKPNSHDQKRVQSHENKVALCLINLTANLMRVARGAGYPFLIERQTEELLHAFEDYSKASGDVGLSASFFQQTLDYQKWREKQSMPDVWLDQIARGSLQLVASKLLRQHLQVASGTKEMINGIGGWNDRNQPSDDDGFIV